MTAVLASYVIADVQSWPKFTEVRRNEILGWLSLNGIKPTSGFAATVEERVDGSWVIRYRALLRSEMGAVRLDPRGSRTVPLTFDPPMYWVQT